MIMCECIIGLKGAHCQVTESCVMNQVTRHVNTVNLHIHVKSEIVYTMLGSVGFIVRDNVCHMQECDLICVFISHTSSMNIFEWGTLSKWWDLFHDILALQVFVQ